MTREEQIELLRQELAAEREKVEKARKSLVLDECYECDRPFPECKSPRCAIFQALAILGEGEKE